jgi:hypothetical protein
MNKLWISKRIGINKYIKLPKLNTYLKKCSTSLALKEMEIKRMLKVPLTPVRMVTNHKKTNNKCW